MGVLLVMAHEEHGHESSKGSEKGKSMSDDLFGKIVDYVSGGIATFVAFLFLLITLGAIFGALVVAHAGTVGGIVPFILIAPAALGVLAYYNRDFAIAIFILLLLFFIFL